MRLARCGDRLLLWHTELQRRCQAMGCQTCSHLLGILHACLESQALGCKAAKLTFFMPCRPAFDEAAAASYELGDAEYAANEVEVTWVTSLLGILVACLQWLQPMLTPGNFDALVASLLDKARLLFAEIHVRWE